jgi:membrane protein YqaA with SNARE-associated domain
MALTAATRRARLLAAALAVGAAAWGVAEASVFFVVPDVLISACGLKGLRPALLATAAALAGALVGGTLMYCWALTDPLAATEVVEAVPFIGPALRADAAALTTAHGGIAMMLRSFTGLPYKVFAVQAPATGMGLATFLLWTVPGRGARFLCSALIAAALARLLRGHIAAPWMRAAWLCVWVSIYTGYWTQMTD